MKVTLITGASDGIGAELARQIAHEGGSAAALVLAARNRERLEAVAAEVRALGARAEVVPTDVTDRAACAALVTEAVARCGGIDVLVNNAGRSAHANFADLTDADLDWYHDLMELNFWGQVWMTHAALPHLIASRGVIATVSSVAGLFGVPGRTAYSATKFALAGFFDALRPEVAGHGVTVLMAYPGVVDTQIRKRGYARGGGEAGVSGVREDAMMSVEECARLLRIGIRHRRREVLMTRQMRLGRWLRMIAPEMTDRVALSQVKEEFRPR